jgi:hypothetical protein
VVSLANAGAASSVPIKIAMGFLRNFKIVSKKWGVQPRGIQYK